MKQLGRGAIQSFAPLPAPADLAVDLLIENVQWPEPAPLDSPFDIGQGGNFVPELLEHVEEEPAMTPMRPSTPSWFGLILMMPCEG